MEAEKKDGVSPTHSFVCTATQPLGAPPGERGRAAVGGRFGFPLFALVSMTICRPPVTVTRNKDGKSEWSKFGEEGEWQGVSKRRDDDDGMGKSLRIVGGLVGIWHHFFKMTMVEGKGREETPTW